MFDRWHRDDGALCACSCWLNIEDRGVKIDGDGAHLSKSAGDAVMGHLLVEQASVWLYNSIQRIAVRVLRGLKAKRKGEKYNTVDSGIVLTGETRER